MKGHIYFWDHERETNPPSFGNVSYVAISFSEFIEKLYEYTELGESFVDSILRQNDLQGLEELLNSGYDVEMKDEYGRTLMENAAIKNRFYQIQILFNHGAELQNALQYAMRNYEFFGEYDITVKLLEELQD